MINKRVLTRIAASSLIIAAAMVGAGNVGLAPSANASGTTEQSRDAMKSADRAEKALAKKDFAAAIGFAEEAVAASPRDAASRMLLGRAYLAGGRLFSAGTTFRDVLDLDPGNGRAALNLALIETALGGKEDARETLSTNAASIPASDRGLALALAGDPAAAVSLLEGVVRAGQADAKTRQNLALSYALAGRWSDAKVMASYDLPEDQVTERIMQWSQFARPASASDQVASLLGISPVADAGQPTRLALGAVDAQPVALAQAKSVPAPVPTVAAAPEPAPVAVAQADPAPAPAPVAPIVEQQSAPLIVASAEPAPAPVSSETQANFAGVTFAPRAEIVQALPVKAAAARTEGLDSFLASKPQRAAAFAPERVAATETKARVLRPAGFQRAAYVKPAATGGQFVVQLGAFSSASRVETAWNKAVGRFGSLRDFSPSTATYVRATPASATLYRLSIGGFAARSEAVRVCERIKTAGGACFVRGVAGDAPLQWASRSAPTRLAAR